MWIRRAVVTLTFAAATVGCATPSSTESVTSTSTPPAETLTPSTTEPADRATDTTAPTPTTWPERDTTESPQPARDATRATPVAVATVPAPETSLANLQTRSIDLEAVLALDDALTMALRPASNGSAADATVHVARQTGEIHRVDQNRGSWELQEEPMFSLGDRTVANKERGLLGFTFSPTGSLLYAVWTDRETNDNVLSEYAMADDGSAVMESERIVLRVAQPFANHNGGNIVFGPDGYLYYGLGDGGASGDPLNSGQDTTSLLGAMLRIDPSDQSSGAYAVPASNPFVDGGGRPEIFMTGLRNPWRFSFDRATGDLWIADVGQDAFEEINVLRSAAGGGAGANLGWNIREGFVAFSDGTAANLTDPLFAYPHANGACSVTGGFVYRGEELPQIQGAYIYGDWCSGDIWALSQDGTINKLLDIRIGSRALASFGETPSGELWILTDGTVFALVPER